MWPWVSHPLSLGLRVLLCERRGWTGSSFRSSVLKSQTLSGTRLCYGDQPSSLNKGRVSVLIFIGHGFDVIANSLSCDEASARFLGRGCPGEPSGTGLRGIRPGKDHTCFSGLAILPPRNKAHGTSTSWWRAGPRRGPGGGALLVGGREGVESCPLSPQGLWGPFLVSSKHRLS